MPCRVRCPTISPRRWPAWSLPTIAIAPSPTAATACWRFRQYNIRQPGSPDAGLHLEVWQLANEILAIPPVDFRRLLDPANEQAAS